MSKMRMEKVLLRIVLFAFLWDLFVCFLFCSLLVHFAKVVAGYPFLKTAVCSSIVHCREELWCLHLKQSSLVLSLELLSILYFLFRNIFAMVLGNALFWLWKLSLIWFFNISRILS